MRVFDGVADLRDALTQQPELDSVRLDLDLENGEDFHSGVVVAVVEPIEGPVTLP